MRACTCAATLLTRTAFLYPALGLSTAPSPKTRTAIAPEGPRPTCGSRAAGSRAAVCQQHKEHGEATARTPHHVEGGHAEEALGVIDALLLQDLRRDRHCAVHRVADDVQQRLIRRPHAVHDQAASSAAQAGAWCRRSCVPQTRMRSVQPALQRRFLRTGCEVAGGWETCSPLGHARRPPR